MINKLADYILNGMARYFYYFYYDDISFNEAIYEVADMIDLYIVDINGNLEVYIPKKWKGRIYTCRSTHNKIYPLYLAIRNVNKNYKLHMLHKVDFEIFRQLIENINENYLHISGNNFKTYLNNYVKKVEYNALRRNNKTTE